MLNPAGPGGGSFSGPYDGGYAFLAVPGAGSSLSLVDGGSDHRPGRGDRAALARCALDGRSAEPTSPQGNAAPSRAHDAPRLGAFSYVVLTYRDISNTIAT